MTTPVTSVKRSLSSVPSQRATTSTTTALARKVAAKRVSTGPPSSEPKSRKPVTEMGDYQPVQMMSNARFDMGIGGGGGSGIEGGQVEVATTTQVVFGIR